MLSFLRKKFKGHSGASLLYGQIEPALFWPLKGVPTFIGFFLRYILCKLLFKRLTGFIWLQPNIVIVAANRIRCGTHIAINSGTYINAIGGIVIGDFVLIGSNVTISSGRHPIDNLIGEIFETPSIPAEISIESGVWIGAGAVIMPGVKLGRGSVIGANAVVTKSTEPFSVNIGVPARFIRQRLHASSGTPNPS
jgi:galactoside O-acetyltransferase